MLSVRRRPTLCNIYATFDGGWKRVPRFLPPKLFFKIYAFVESSPRFLFNQIGKHFWCVDMTQYTIYSLVGFFLSSKCECVSILFYLVIHV